MGLLVFHATVLYDRAQSYTYPVAEETFMENDDPIERRIEINLLEAGFRRGGVVLVHSSVRSLGPLPGGLEPVVRGLLAALGEDGTLLMPALSYLHVTPAQPFFDARRTPSNVGSLPEYFRNRPGTLRSTHPTHSVCGVGPLAGRILGRHHLDCTPVGPNSPFRALGDLDGQGGQILFLGCGLSPNTSMHGLEELVEPPYLFHSETEYHLIHPDGRTSRMRMRNHDFRNTMQRYERLAEILAPDELKQGRVLDAPVQIVDCRPMWEKALAILKRDPLYFVDIVNRSA